MNQQTYPIKPDVSDPKPVSYRVPGFYGFFQRISVPVVSFLILAVILLLASAIAARHLGLEPLPAWTFVPFLGLTIYAIGSALIIWQLLRHGFLQKSLMNDLLERSWAGRLILNAKGERLCANLEAQRLTDRNVSLKGLKALFAEPAASATAFSNLYDRAIHGESGVLELESKKHHAWYSLSAYPLQDLRGYVQWRIADITARRSFEEVQHAERSKLLDFLDNAPGGFFSVGAEGEFLFVNRTFADWVGASVTALLSGTHRLHDFLDTPPTGANPYDLFADGGASQHGEVVFKSLDGRLLPAAVAQTVETDSESGGLRTRAIVRDLKSERQWQAALALSQRRFQRFFRDAPIGIALIDKNGIISECNLEMGEMIGRPLSEVVGLHLSALLSAGDWAILNKTISLADNQIPEHSIEVKLNGPKESVAQLYARRFYDSESSEDGFILHFIDLMEQKKLEQQFVQSQKMQAVGQLAGGIAHDFNNLLTAMIGFCDLLLLRHKPGDPSFGDIMQIKQNGNRAANLVRQLLAFSRQQTLQPRVLDVTDAITELSHLLRRLIGENIELKMIHGRDLGLVKVDQGQLEQVLINLCVNARDAMPRGGKLTVRTNNKRSRAATQMVGDEMPSGEWVVISVSDTGTGIPQDIVSRIFEPFFSTKEVGAGTGLGLSTVYGIVRQTGGYVNVDSELGEGTTFHIYLPRHADTVPTAIEIDSDTVQEKQGADLTGVGQILLVEDEDAVRMFSARALRNKGYSVQEANSGENALEVLAKNPGAIDLLITDVIMPHMDGPTLVEEVKRTQPDLKVIFISGYTEDRVRSQFGSNEQIHFLPKPFTLKQLASKVKEVIHPPE